MTKATFNYFGEKDDLKKGVFGSYIMIAIIINKNNKTTIQCSPLKYNVIFTIMVRSPSSLHSRPTPANPTTPILQSTPLL